MKTHPLIDLMANPTMPSPTSSCDGGEAWVVGDFYVLTINRPVPVYRKLEQLTGEHMAVPIEIDYRTALSIFYKLNKNPHGPSVRPIAVYTIERFKIPGEADKQVVSEVEETGNRTIGTDYMMCEFYDGKHFNFGICVGDGSVQTDRDQMMNQFLKDFEITDRPKLIGSIVDVAGHPETGVPQIERHLNSSLGRGCLSGLRIAMLTSFAVTLIIIFIRALSIHD